MVIFLALVGIMSSTNINNLEVSLTPRKAHSLILNNWRAPTKRFKVPLEMYSSLGFILASLPLLTAAAPPVDVPTSRGIAVPITKRGSPLDGVVDTSKLQSRIRRSVA